MMHEVGVTWLGHATVLLQLGGRAVLTDPVFSERLLPRWLPDRVADAIAAPRLRPAPAELAQLDPDVVLSSHSHMDHLDEASWTFFATRACLHAFRCSSFVARPR